ncbi:hypothetical protein [Rhodanobacter fulvus]|uniref:hypothetical protein n=1 Tax=Rhodanobacter fulvus TaxID=219571 RepID=UPI000A067F03|nr:hypothetical protein [Rhodanobacter fulvus]
MNQEINKHVAQALVEMALFLEFSGDMIIDPDAAVQALEQLSSTLQMANVETKASLCLHFENIALEYQGDKAEFVRGMGEELGLIDE